jgi:hypothetical protein
MQTHRCSSPRMKVDLSLPLVSSPGILSMFYWVPSGLQNCFDLAFWLYQPASETAFILLACDAGTVLCLLIL